MTSIEPRSKGTVLITLIQLCYAPIEGMKELYNVMYCFLSNNIYNFLLNHNHSDRHLIFTWQNIFTSKAAADDRNCIKQPPSHFLLANFTFTYQSTQNI